METVLLTHLLRGSVIICNRNYPIVHAASITQCHTSYYIRRHVDWHLFRTHLETLAVAHTCATHCVDMESNKTCSYLQQVGFNGNTEASSDNTTDVIYFTDIAVLMVSVLGLPGNLLVVAVYFRLQTTSTRIYMLSLALADLESCVCVIILASKSVPIEALYVILVAADISTGFSAMFLAFISWERLVAVRRPLTVSFSPERAKKAVICIAVFDGIVTVVFDVARHTCCPLLGRIIVMSLLCMTVVVMIICYIIVSATLLKNARNSRATVGVDVGISLPASGISVVKETIDVDTAGQMTPNMTVLPPTSYSKHISCNNAKNYKNVYLLLTVTVVYIITWLPLWVFYSGVAVPCVVQRMFLLNSVVNPFIYSIMSSMFRDDLRMFFRKTRSRLVDCCR